MTPTAWNHLPNAALIDFILHDIMVNTNKWASAWHAAWDEDWYAASWLEARDAAKAAAWNAGQHEVWDAGRNTIQTAILALIAWDEAADYLLMPSDQVQVLATLGDNKAVLMWPAVVALEKSKELT